MGLACADTKKGSGLDDLPLHIEAVQVAVVSPEDHEAVTAHNNGAVPTAWTGSPPQTGLTDQHLCGVGQINDPTGQVRESTQIGAGNVIPRQAMHTLTSPWLWYMWARPIS